MKNGSPLNTTKFPGHLAVSIQQYHHRFPLFWELSNTSAFGSSASDTGQSFNLKAIRMSLLIVWVKSMRSKAVSWPWSGRTVASLCFQTLWGLALASSWITRCSWTCWALASAPLSPRAVPPGPPGQRWTRWLAVLQVCASRMWPAHFVNLTPDVKLLITDPKFSLLGDLKLQAALR